MNQLNPCESVNRESGLARDWSAVAHHFRLSSDERFLSWSLAVGDRENAERSYTLMAAEIGWLRPASDEDVLLMMENPDPDALEPWRLECEARYVLKMKTKEERREWIERVAKKRSQSEADRLEAEVKRLWTTQKRG